MRDLTLYNTRVSAEDKIEETGIFFSFDFLYENQSTTLLCDSSRYPTYIVFVIKCKFHGRLIAQQ